MEKNGLSKNGYQQAFGKAPEEMPPRPLLSSIKVIDHVPVSDKLNKILRPSIEQMEQRRILRHRHLEAKAAQKQKMMKALLGIEFDDFESDQKGLHQLYSNAKQALGPTFDLPIDIIQPADCRLRDVTVRECLTEVCVDQKEHMPVFGNWSYRVAEPITVTPGEFPAFSITDCVDAGNGYTNSEGHIWVGASIEMTHAAHIKEFGVDFSGLASYDVDGEDHLFGDDWGQIWATSIFDIRSLAPNGGLSLLNPTVVHTEVLEKNDSGPTAAKPLYLSTHSNSVNLNVDEGHRFFAEYTLRWDLSRSDDYSSRACFSISALSFKPYIIYESCHNEYQQVSQLLAGMK
jgi:hypothetical protein